MSDEVGLHEGAFEASEGDKEEEEVSAFQEGLVDRDSDGMPLEAGSVAGLVGVALAWVDSEGEHRKGQGEDEEGKEEEGTAASCDEDSEEGRASIDLVEPLDET